MELLEKKILEDGVIKSGNVLKVDSFLNHQIDVPFIAELGKEFKRLFADRPINKILTIEASGIGIACVAAMYFQVPVVFAKKQAAVIWIVMFILLKFIPLPTIRKTMLSLLNNI